MIPKGPSTSLQKVFWGGFGGLKPLLRRYVLDPWGMLGVFAYGRSFLLHPSGLAIFGPATFFLGGARESSASSSYASLSSALLIFWGLRTKKKVWEKLQNRKEHQNQSELKILKNQEPKPKKHLEKYRQKH